MANENKNSQDANAIENINSTLTGASQRLANNKKVIYWLCGGIAVVAVLILSYLFIYRNPRVNKSWDAYGKVQLELAKQTMSDSVAAGEYAKVADNYGGTPAGEIAALSAAESYYNLGKWDAAIKYLEKFSCSEPVMEAQAKVLLADCYVNKGKEFYGKALDLYKKAASISDGNAQIVPAILLKEANVYDAQKDYSSALKCYEEIKTNFPEFMPGNGMLIDGYIEREKARGAK